jgi:hypothetical protein
MNDTINRTDFLFPKRNFWTVFSSVLNIFGDQNKFNVSSSGEEADLKALSYDWEMIGQDVKNALNDI